ncbi:hypothetical protein SVIOM342S_05007 [Streptomyces violaceorubidus]
MRRGRLRASRSCRSTGGFPYEQRRPCDEAPIISGNTLPGSPTGGRGAVSSVRCGLGDQSASPLAPRLDLPTARSADRTQACTSSTSPVRRHRQQKCFMLPSTPSPADGVLVFAFAALSGTARRRPTRSQECIREHSRPGGGIHEQAQQAVTAWLFGPRHAALAQEGVGHRRGPPAPRLVGWQGPVRTTRTPHARPPRGPTDHHRDSHRHHHRRAHARAKIRRLLRLVRVQPEFTGWTSHEVMRFLYEHFYLGPGNAPSEDRPGRARPPVGGMPGRRVHLRRGGRARRSLPATRS